MRKNSCLFAIGTLLTVLVACSPALYKPTLQTSGSPERFEELNRGRALYVSKCSSCHNLHRPEEYPAKIWSHNINEMQGRAEISDEQKKLILNYLTSK
jgi:mono/diheme cytochrome c family protein